MKRWISKAGRFQQSPKEIDAFLADIEAVCRKHGMSLSHEDHHGAFEIEAFSEDRLEWLKDAHDQR